MIESPRGITLLEMIVVVAIIAVLATIAVPMFNSYAINTNLKSAVRDIASDILSMKERATSENRQYRLVFNVGSNNYTIEQGTAAGAPFVVLLTKSPTEFGDDITLTKATFGVGSTITFQTRGTSSFGTIALTNTRGSTATITVNMAGRTHVDLQII